MRFRHGILKNEVEALMKHEQLQGSPRKRMKILKNRVSSKCSGPLKIKNYKAHKGNVVDMNKMSRFSI